MILDARLFSPAFYTSHPALAGGQNAFWVAGRGDRLNGFEVLFPPQTPQTWLGIQPYAEMRLGSQSLIIVQPSASAIVYLLGLVAMVGGCETLRDSKSLSVFDRLPG